jgi:hypothetical protein
MSPLRTLALGIALGAVPTALVAGIPSLPHTFANGTVADAAEVNANFAELVAQVTDNHNRIGAAAGTVFAQSHHVESMSSLAFGNTDYFTVPGSAVTLTGVPAGRAVITWSTTFYSSSGAGGYTIRPVIGGAPEGEVNVYTNEGGSHKGASGSAVVNIGAGDHVMLLQAKRRNGGNYSVDSNDSLSWTVVVHPN